MPKYGLQNLWSNDCPAVDHDYVAVDQSTDYQHRFSMQFRLRA